MTKSITEVNLNVDMLEVEDITNRVDELRELLEEANESDYTEERQELHFLEQTLGEMQGYGGNHQWEGHWYPDYLIADRHFKTYAKELAYDISGKELREASWPMNCIDWEKATEQLQMDYTSITIDGHEFLYAA